LVASASEGLSDRFWALRGVIGCDGGDFEGTAGDQGTTTDRYGDGGRREEGGVEVACDVGMLTAWGEAKPTTKELVAVARVT
jgi:hypothetical protein